MSTPAGEIELLQLIDRLRCRLDDVEQAFVRAHLELVHALFVDVRRAVDRVALDLRGERDRTGDDRAGARGGLGDLGRGAIEKAVIECLEANADACFGHKIYLPFFCSVI